MAMILSVPADNSKYIAQVKPGSLIKFEKETRSYRVKACNKKFAIATKPHFGTVLYTIVDWEQNIRGRENLIFCMGFEKVKSCEEALERLTNNESAVSTRYYCQLDIQKIIP